MEEDQEANLKEEAAKQNQQHANDEEPTKQHKKAGKLLFPEEKPHARGFFQLHAMFSPECGFDPGLVAVDEQHIFDDMPALGPLIIQGPQPAPLLSIDDLLAPSPSPPPPQQQQRERQQKHEAESHTALDLLTMESRPSDLLW